MAQLGSSSVTFLLSRDCEENVLGTEPVPLLANAVPQPVPALPDVVGKADIMCPVCVRDVLAHQHVTVTRQPPLLHAHVTPCDVKPPVRVRLKIVFPHVMTAPLARVVIVHDIPLLTLPEPYEGSGERDDGKDATVAELVSRLLH